MTWYIGIYGSWAKDGVERIGGSYSRKEMFAKAQEVANEKKETVKIIAETGSVSGLRMKVYEINPQ